MSRSSTTTSTTTASNPSNFQSVNTKSNSMGLKMRYNTKPSRSTFSSTRGTTIKTKFQSGKLDMNQTDDDFEDITITPFNKRLFLFTLFLPCIGFFGLCQLKAQNRREKLWGILLLFYAVLMTFIFIILLVFAIAFY